MKISLVLLVACTSGHTSAAISGASQALANDARSDVGKGGRLRSTAARSEAQSRLSRAEATVGETVGEELAHPKPGLVRRFVAFLAEKAGIPLPTINHQKTPGNGYSPGSPMFNDQEAWVARNGDNVHVGTGDNHDGVLNDFEADLRWVAAMGFLVVFLQFFLSFLIFALVTYLYLHFSPGWRQTRFLEQVGTHQDFLHDCCDLNCCSNENPFDWQICLCALCCPFLRWADTVSSTKMFPGKFWLAFFTMLIINLFWPVLSLLLVIPLLALILPATASWCWPCIMACPMSMLGVYFRQQMRTKFGHDAGNPCTKPGTWLCDVALWFCCFCCVIAQEAREVEKVNPGFVRNVNRKVCWDSRIHGWGKGQGGGAYNGDGGGGGCGGGGGDGG